jgi:hypothetical protein
MGTVMQPALLDYLLQEQRWCIESGQGWVAVYRAGDEVGIPKLSAFFEETRRIFRLLWSGAKR